MTPSQKRASLILQVRAGQITAQEAAQQLGISRQAYYKWEKRALAALLQSLEDQPLAGQLLRHQIQQLPHRRRRTAGTSALHQQWSEFISRRDFQELVAQERQNRIADMKRIQWLKPGVAWSLDTTEYGLEKIKI